MDDLKKAVLNLISGVETAIKAGDWNVDGACDPELAIRHCREALADHIAEADKMVAEPDVFIPWDKVKPEAIESDPMYQMGYKAGLAEPFQQLQAYPDKPFVMANQATPRAEPVKQEPVAWWLPKHKRPEMVSLVRWSDECEPLYAAPVERQWVDLTNDEIVSVLEYYDHEWDETTFAIARAVIAAFKAKQGENK